MFTSTSLTVLGIFFLLTIAVFYFKKKRYFDINNKVYSFLLIFTLIMLLLELTCVYTMSIKEKIPLINEVFCRSYVFGTLIWLINIVAYINCVIGKKKYNNIKELYLEKGMILFIIFTISMFIISCFLEITYNSGAQNQYNVIGGPGVLSLYVIFGLVSINLIVRMLYKINKNNFIERIPMLMFFIFFGLFEIIQIFSVDINELTFLFAFCLVSIYFTFASQDSKLVEELNEAKHEAEIADEAKTKFLAKISHEIRTPMNVIMGYSELLINKKEVKEEEVQKDVQNIYNAGKGLLELINNILIYSRIESGKEKIEEIEYSISDIIGELESFAHAKIDPTKVKFSIILDSDIPTNYVGDKLKVYRILLNLINNSIKYTEKGEITLKIKCNVITENIAQLIFEVKDTGIGIMKDNLENMYDQLNKVNDKNYDISGIGLGLSLSKKIINMLEGSIVCESEFGIGTTFTVKLNQKTIGDTTIKDLQHLKDKIGEKNSQYFDCSAYKVLIVDDNKLNRLVVERLLKPYKINYESIDSSTKCIEKIKEGEKYDLILLDHMMPVLDGIETVRILKKMNIKTLPPVVVVTANVVTEMKERYIKEGFSDYLSKPVDIKELNKLLHKYFEKESESDK